ncbi:MAG: GntR family transcriptional regulator [Chloroflexi bacterium]|nr:GntR family transcriptional regulator [Chloroflexota bacterium]
MSLGSPMRGRTLRELVLDQISSDLVQGRLKPGDPLDQGEIAARLGVSRTPVREALVLLEAQGVVEAEPRRGQVIRALSPDEIEDDYLVLATLERLLSGLAVPRLTPENLARMKGLHTQADLLLENGCRADLHEVNRKFHQTLYRACGRPRLIQFLEANLWTHTRHYNRLYIDLPGAAVWRQEIHGQITEACQQGDVERVQELVFVAARDTGRRVADLLRQAETPAHESTV